MSSELKMFLQNGYKMTGDLPLHIPDKISTIEDIYYLCSIVQTALDKVNDLTNVSNTYTDEKIEEMTNTLKTELLIINSQLEDLAKNCNSYTDNEISKISQELVNSCNVINESIASILSETTRLNQQVIDLKQMVANGGMSVLCPTCGIPMSIQDALYHIYNAIRVTITWTEFEEKVSSMTWDSFDESMSGVTWTQFEYSINDVMNLGLETINLENN